MSMRTTVSSSLSVRSPRRAGAPSLLRAGTLSVLCASAIGTLAATGRCPSARAEGTRAEPAKAAPGGTAVHGGGHGSAPAQAQAQAQAQAPAQDPQNTDPAKMMEEMAKLMAPNENHERLKALVGKWNVTTRMWMQPGAPPEETRGTADIKLFPGGRFVQEDFRGKIMGKPFSGFALTGYDNTKQKYQMLWVDSMSTCMTVSEGTVDETGKVVTTVAAPIDPITKKPAQMKFVMTLESDKKHTTETYERGKDGKEFRTMEIVYTRK